MGEHQVAVEPGAGGGWQGGRIHLPGRDHHQLAALIAGLAEVVAIDGGLGEAVVHPQLLQLLIGGQQGLAVPEPHAAQRGLAGLHIGAGEAGLRADVAAGDPVELESLPGGLDRAGQIGSLLLQLAGLDHDQLQHRQEQGFQQGHQKQHTATDQHGGGPQTRAGQLEGHRHR